MTGHWIETLTWPEVAACLEAGWPVVVPVGARSKEHGHHLPMQTDYLLARAFGDGIAAALPALIAPVVDFGYYPAFLRYPGSQHLKSSTFIAVMGEVIERFLDQGAAHVVVVNTGVSTEAPIEIAARDILASRGVQVSVAHIRDLGRGRRSLLTQKMGGHGDEHETSLMLAIAPEQVDMAKAATDYGHMLDQPRSVFHRPVQFGDDPDSGTNYSATGVRGDPTLATVEKGRAILAAMIEELVEGLRPFCPAPAGSPAPAG